MLLSKYLTTGTVWLHFTSNAPSPHPCCCLSIKTSAIFIHIMFDVSNHEQYIHHYVCMLWVIMPLCVHVRTSTHTSETDRCLHFLKVTWILILSQCLACTKPWYMHDAVLYEIVGSGPIVSNCNLEINSFDELILKCCCIFRVTWSF